MCLGTMLGLCASVQSLLRTVGPTIGGFLYETYGVASFGYIQFTINAVVFSLLFMSLRQTHTAHEHLGWCLGCFHAWSVKSFTANSDRLVTFFSYICEHGSDSDPLKGTELWHVGGVVSVQFTLSLRPGLLSQFWPSALAVGKSRGTAPVNYFFF